MAALLVYFVIVGGTAAGEVSASLRFVNAGLSIALIAIYVARAPGSADRIDRTILMALLLFLAASILSSIPRQSLDAAFTALAYAAAFFIARGMLGVERYRGVAVRTLIVLSGFMTLTTAARWLPLVWEWSTLNHLMVVPPLDLPLPAWPYGHRHDLALLVAVLYPSWWIGAPGLQRRATALLVGGVGLAVVVVDGSRSVWLAILIATAVLGTPRLLRFLSASRARLAIAASSAVAVAAIGLASGLTDSVLERLAAGNTLSARSTMWASIVESWSAHPLSGNGPGSFPWILQGTGYFDAQTWAPRHPDSVFFQLLAEGGVLGLLCVALIALALLPPVLRQRSNAARWAVIVFTAAGIGMSPTDFGFLIAIAIIWTAYALPRQATAAAKSRKWFRVSAGAATILIAVAYGSTVIAALAHSNAVADVMRNDLSKAQANLSTAVRLDPGMALYWRERGTLSLITDSPTAAVRDLEEAVGLNPSDDAAWRRLAIAYRLLGWPDQASAAIDQAVDVQRSDPTNLLLKATWAVRDGERSSALMILGEVVQAWPAILAAPGWDEAFPPTSLSRDDVVDAAVARHRSHLGAPDGNFTLLAVLSNLSRELRSITNGDVIQARAAMSYLCPADRTVQLPAVSLAERRTVDYWEGRVRASAWRGTLDYPATRVWQIMTASSADRGALRQTLDPLGDSDAAGFSADAWGYRRETIDWPRFGRLPSPWTGALTWLLDPSLGSERSGVSGCSAP